MADDRESRRKLALVAQIRAIDTVCNLNYVAPNTVVARWPEGTPDNPAVLALIAGFDWSDGADLIDLRNLAVFDLNKSNDKLTMQFWGTMLAVLDEINVLRARFRAMDAALAANSTLGGYKLAIAALPAFLDRTVAQAKQAAYNKITNGQT